MKKKKVLLGLAIAATSVLSLASCGAKGKKTTSSSISGNTASSEAASSTAKSSSAAKSSKTSSSTKKSSSISTKASSSAVASSAASSSAVSSSDEQPTKYTVDIYDGNSLISTLKVEKNTLASSIEIAVDDGYVLDAFYSDADLTAKLASDYIIEDNITLYVQIIQALDFIHPTKYSPEGSFLADDEYYVAGLDEYTGTELVIPKTYNGLPVTGIDYEAFKSNTAITSVSLGANVVYIDDAAFYGCSSLSTINLNKVEAIGSGAFSNCKALKEIDLTNIQALYGHTFYNSGLETVTLGSNLTNVIGADFKNCYKLKEIYNLSSLTVDESDSCGEIGCYGAYVHTKLEKSAIKTFNGFEYYYKGEELYIVNYVGTNTTVTLPLTIDGMSCNICKYAFTDTVIEALIIPDGITSIDAYAFYSADNLSKVTLPASLETIEKSAFEDCNKLVIVNNYSDTLTLVKGSTDNGYVAYSAVVINTVSSIDIDFIEVGDYRFLLYNGEYRLVGYSGTDTILTLPDQVDGNDYIIGDFAFSETNVEEVTIPSSVLSIGVCAFYGCENLAKVTINEGVEEILTNAFAGTAISEITIPNSVTKLANLSFAYNSNLMTVTIGSSVSNVATTAFNNCYHLVEVYNLSSLDITCGSSECGGVAKYALKVHSNKTEESILFEYNDYTFALVGTESGGVTSYSYYLVRYNGNESILELPEGYPISTSGSTAYNIHSYAFYEKEISELTINNKVVSIGDYAFFNTDIEKLHILNGLYYIGDYAFSGCNISDLVLCDTIQSIGDYAFANCAVETLTVPTSCQYIGDYAFEYSSIKHLIVTSACQVGTMAFSNSSLEDIVINANATITNDTFENCSSLKNIYVLGTEATELVNNLSGLLNIYYYTENGANETKSGVWWYYDEDGNIVTMTRYDITYNIDDVEYAVVLDSTDNLDASAYIPSGFIVDGLYTDSAFRNRIDSECPTESITIYVKYVQDLIYENYGCYEYYIVNGFNTVSNFLLIPDTYNNLPVKEIAEEAFAGNGDIKTVVLGKNLETIGNNAFVEIDSLHVCNFSSNITLVKNSSSNGNIVALTERVINYSSYEWKLYNGGIYAYSGSDCYLAAYIGEAENLELPDKFNGYKYTIYKYAFSYSNVQNVTIPSYIYISEYAFLSSKYLKSLTIEEGITNIPDYTFFKCEKLETINLPDSLTSISSLVFNGCYSLSNINFGSGLESIGVSAFDHCIALEKLVLPDTVTTLGRYAFADCQSLKSLILDANTSSIACDAFVNTPLLTEVYYIGTKTDRAAISYTSSGDNSLEDKTWYYYTDNIDSETDVENYWTYSDGAIIKYPKCEVTYVLNGASYDTTVNYNSTFTIPDVIPSGYILDGVYLDSDYTNRISNVIIYESQTVYVKIVQNLGYDLSSDETYYTVTNMEGNSHILGADARSIVIPDTYLDLPVKKIADGAFYECNSLYVLVVGKNIISELNYCFNLIGFQIFNFASGVSASDFVGEPNFYDYTSYTYEMVNGYGFAYNDSSKLLIADILNSKTSALPATFRNSTYTIASYAFSNSLVENLTIPANIQINSYAANEAAALKTLTIEEGIITIPEYAFYGCENLVTVSLPDSLGVIENSVFNSCTVLKNLDLGNGVQTIGMKSFWNCNALKQVILPDSVTTIENQAFYYCSSLTSIVIGEGMATIATNAFDETAITEVYYTKNENMASYIVYVGDGTCKIKESDVKWFYYLHIDDKTDDTHGNYWYYKTDGSIETWTA